MQPGSPGSLLAWGAAWTMTASRTSAISMKLLKDFGNCIVFESEAKKSNMWVVDTVFLSDNTGYLCRLEVQRESMLLENHFHPLSRAKKNMVGVFEGKAKTMRAGCAKCREGNQFIPGTSVLLGFRKSYDTHFDHRLTFVVYHLSKRCTGTRDKATFGVGIT